MEINLTKKPKSPIIIEGFPGFGLVGTIATEFLIDHLKCEFIGKFWLEEMPATVAIHDKELVHPVGIFYNSKYNIVIIHSITGATGVEWKMADMVNDVAQKLKAKEIISIEGVGSSSATEGERTFYYTSDKAQAEKLKKIGVTPLNEGIIMGVTSALLLKCDVPLIGIFAETHTDMPDSNAAAKIIEVLDKYLGLQVDPKPLRQTADKFEAKLRGIMEKGKAAQDMRDKKALSYIN